jgi:bacillithiol system protein YtxJ
MIDRDLTQAQFVPLENSGGLDQLLQDSHERPVVLFKHSVTCPVSADAYHEMAQYPGRVDLVVVQTARSVSNDIETRLGVRHESPQVILMVRGEPVWRASHWKINAADLARAVGDNL